MRSRYLLAALIVAGLALVIALPIPAGETPSKEKIDKLIEQMGSGSFVEREKATKELSAIGVPALEALRQAAKSEDAEVRKRAGDIIPKIESQAESLRILAPKRVHLVYKDTPLSEAVDDFQSKSGYTIHLYDPDEKLKDRKITLDTGETAFWHALELFCAKAELTEASTEDLKPALPVAKPLPPAGRPVPVPPIPGVKPAPIQVAPPVIKPAIARRGRVFVPAVPGMAEQIVLKPGKFTKLPTDDRSAVRVRALLKADGFAKAPEGESVIALEVSPEPRMQWQEFQSVRVEKAMDNQDQKLSQVIAQVEGRVGGLGGVAVPLGPAALIARPAIAGPIMMGGSLHQSVAVQLKKGTKPAKSLKELKGVLTARILTKARPMITADKLDKAAGKVFKGEEGGFIKIVEVKSAKEQTTIRLEFEQPPADKVVPAMPNMPGLGGFVPPGLPRPGVRILPAPAGAAPAPPPPPAPPAPAAPPGGLAAQAPAAPPPPVAQARIQIGGGGGGIAFGGAMQFPGSFNGLSVQDAKGNPLSIRVQQMQFRVVQQGNGVPVQTLTYTLICQHGKDNGQPAKVVFLGRQRKTIDVPFTLKDVPLP